MAFEIEHKYIVINDTYKKLSTSHHFIKQGYLSRNPERTVRIRILDEQGFITVKGITRGAKRHEFEYPIPSKDADEMLSMCVPPIIEKIRYKIPYKGHVWEVDEFKGALNHVVLAEIELNSTDEKYALPPFVGQNITGDADYYNSNLHKLGTPHT